MNFDRVTRTNMDTEQVMKYENVCGTVMVVVVEVFPSTVTKDTTKAKNLKCYLLKQTGY